VPLNALTIDVEDYFAAEALSAAAPRADWASLPSRVEANTERVLALLERHDVRATFFVLGWVAERFPGLVRKIAAQGHEIASHGYSHRVVYAQSPADFREETFKSRQLLQDLSGQDVAGYRAATFSITRASLWALDILAEAGFRYDSSIFPIHHDLYGIPGSPTEPYEVTTSAGRLIEIPLTTLKVGPLCLPASGGGAFRLLPRSLAMAMLAAVNRQGRPFVFYFHPWEIDPGQPRFDVGLRSRLRHYTNLGRFEARLEHLLERFRFGTMTDVFLPLERVSPHPVFAAAELAS
jgi:polysaccharide deacetylase family protein (PEP-CTERM system associated)